MSEIVPQKKNSLKNILIVKDLTSCVHHSSILGASKKIPFPLPSENVNSILTG